MTTKLLKTQEQALALQANPECISWLMLKISETCSGDRLW